MHIDMRKLLYEALYPETKKGVAGGKAGGRGRKKVASEKVSFATDTAKKTKKSKRSVEMKVKIGAALKPYTDRLADTRLQKNLHSLSH